MYEDICLHCGRPVDDNTLYCSADCEALELASTFSDLVGTDDIERDEDALFSMDLSDHSPADGPFKDLYVGQSSNSHTHLRGDSSIEYSRQNYHRSSLSSSSVSSVLSTPASPSLADDEETWKELSEDSLYLQQVSNLDVGVGTMVDLGRYQGSLSPPAALSMKRKYLNRRSVDSIDPILVGFDKLTYARRPSATNTRSVIPSPLPPLSHNRRPHGLTHRRALSSTVPEPAYNLFSSSGPTPSSTSASASASASRSRSRTSLNMRDNNIGLKSAPIIFTEYHHSRGNIFKHDYSNDQRPKISKSMSERNQLRLEIDNFHDNNNTMLETKFKNRHRRGRASLPSYLSLLKVGISAPATPVISPEMALGKSSSSSPPLSAADFVDITQSEPIPTSPTATLKLSAMANSPTESHSSTPVSRFRKLTLSSDEVDGRGIGNSNIITERSSSSSENCGGNLGGGFQNTDSKFGLDESLVCNISITHNLSTITIKEASQDLELEIPRGRSRARRPFSSRERDIHTQPQIGLGYGFGFDRGSYDNSREKMSIINERPVGLDLHSKVAERGRSESRGRCRHRKEREFPDPRTTSWAPAGHRVGMTWDRGNVTIMQ